MKSATYHYFLIAILVTFQSNLLSQTPGSLKWKYKSNILGSNYSTTPAISLDGSIYVCTSDGYLIALSPSGNERWRFKSLNETGLTATSIQISSPSVSSDGIVYFTAISNHDKGYAYAINSDGSLKWKHQIKYPSSKPAISDQGGIYIWTRIANFQEELRALDQNGSMIWSLRAEEQGWGDQSSVTIGHDGSIYAVCDTSIMSIASNGTIKWRYKTSEVSAQPPSIGNDGRIFCISRGGNLYSLNPDGSYNWNYDLKTATYRGINVWSAIVIDKNKNIYLGSGDSCLYTFTYNGKFKWKYKISSMLNSTPTIDSNGILYIAAEKIVYAINPDGSLQWKYQMEESKDQFSSLNLASDGTLYVGGNAEPLFASIYAINTNSQGLSDNYFSKIYFDSRNSSNQINKSCPVAITSFDTAYVEPGGTLTLDGSKSFDPDNDKQDYYWRIVEKPETSSSTILNPTEAKASIKFNQQDIGLYTLSLSVTDQKDGASSKRIHVSCGIKNLYYEKNCTEVNDFKLAIAPDGTIYYPVITAADSSKLIAIGVDGKKKWEYAMSDRLSTPVIGDDGTIYIGNTMAITPNGTLKWSDLHDGYPGQGMGGNKVTLGANNNIINVVWARGLWTVNPEGTFAWNTSLEYDVFKPACVDQSGNIYVGGLNSYDLNGKARWSASVTGKLVTQIAIGQYGIIFFGNVTHNWGAGYQHEVFAVSADGATVWKYLFGTTQDERDYLFASGPVVDPGGVIYICSDDGRIEAITVEGKLKWRYRTNDEFSRSRSSILVGIDGTIYTMSTKGIIYAFTSEGQLAWKYQSTSFSLISILDSGYLVTSTLDGINMIKCSSNGLARTFWPKTFHDNQNTSNINTSLEASNVSLTPNSFPVSFAIIESYPNPFNSCTNFLINIPTASKISISIYNIKGELAHELFEGNRSAGAHIFKWDANGMSSGVYFVKLQGKAFSATVKCLLVR